MINQKNCNLLYKEQTSYFRDRDSDRKKNKVWLESLILIGLVFAFSFYAVSVDLFERITEWIKTHE